MTHELGRTLILFGVFLVVVGVVLVFADRIPYVGRLPGDVVIRKKNLTVYVPIVTGLLLSVLLTIILSLASRR